jgi:DNA invertase Pin-like site-specific DNA recombinase
MRLLDAQRQSVLAYLTGVKPLHEFVEVESGRLTDRPKLAEALVACRLFRATLVIAKLDRLARNVAFVSNLLAAGVDFIAVDFPTANRLTIHILAAVAEHEAKMISERTRGALAAAKARGTTLGGWKGRAGTCTDLTKARAVRVAKANRRAIDLTPSIRKLQFEGANSLRVVAAQAYRCAGREIPQGGSSAQDRAQGRQGRRQHPARQRDAIDWRAAGGVDVQVRQSLGARMDSRSVQGKDAEGPDYSREVQYLSLRGSQREGYRSAQTRHAGERRDDEDCRGDAQRKALGCKIEGLP